MPQSSRGAAPPLAATLRSEAKPLAGVLAVLGASMALRLCLPLLLGRFAIAVLETIDPRATLAIVVPIVVAAAATTWLGPRLRRWRRAAREATAQVTGFIGDTFGGVLAVQAGGGRDAVQERFAGLNAERAQLSRRDQVGSELVRSLGYGTGEVAWGSCWWPLPPPSGAATSASATSACSPPTPP